MGMNDFIREHIRHRWISTRPLINKAFRWLIIILIYLVIFCTLDFLSFRFQIFPGVVAWYPPDGVSLAFLFTFGAGFTPLVALASIISSLVIYQFSTPIAPILVWALILSIAYGLLAVFLRRKRSSDRHTVHLRDLVRWIIASIIITILLAVISVFNLVEYGAVPISQVLYAVMQWWVGELIGLCVFTPFLLIYILPGIKRFSNGEKIFFNKKVLRKPTSQEISQTISMLVILYLVFGIPALQEFHPFFLIAIPLIWVAITKGFRQTTVAVVLSNFGIMLAIWLFKFESSLLGEFQFLMFGIYFSVLLLGALVSKQKASEEELNQKEIHFKALIENAPDAIILLDSERKIRYQSPATERILGYKVEENLGTDPGELTHPEQIQMLKKVYLKLLRSPGLVTTAQYQIKHKDGSWHWVESTFSNQLKNPGINAIVVNFREITERIHSEQEIAILAKISSESPNPDLRMTPEGMLLYANPASEPILQMWQCAIKEKVPEYMINVAAVAIARNENIPVEITCEDKVYSVTVTPINEMGYVNLYGRDITKRVKAEESLKISNDELSMLFELSHSLAEADHLDDILNIVNHHAVDSVHNTFARIALLDDKDFEIRAAYPIREIDQDFAIGERFPVSVLMTAHNILERNEPTVIHANDPEISDLEKKILLLDVAQSVCLIPLRISDSSPDSEKMVGLLMLGEVRSNERQPFTPEKIRLARTIGDSAAIAIRRMLLREQTERRMQQLLALSEIDLAIISNSDMRARLEVVCTQVLEQLKVDAADIWVLDAKTKTLQIAIGRGFRTPLYEMSKPIQLGESIVGRAAREQKTIFIPNLTAYNENPRFAKALKEEPFENYYAVPLIVKDQLKGVLEVFHRTDLKVNEDWVKFLHALANQTAIAIDNSSLFNDLQQSNIELTQAYDVTIQGWSRALDLRDNETEGHTQRVTELTMKLCRLFGISEEELVHIRRGALLHDIGKMGVPDKILLKPGPLTDEEWVVMKQHTTFAYDLLSPIQYLQPALDIPYCHHEKWDGSGYPRGLAGEQIPFAASIFSVVDVWDALTSDRPYRPAWPEEKVFDHIRSLSGTHFDPVVVKICLESGLLMEYPKKRTRMEPLQWSERFSVGLKELDFQHQKLINLLNRMILISGTTGIHSDMIKSILAEMTSYANIHFKAEEVLMEKYGFPGMKDHKKSHLDFELKTMELYPEIEHNVEGTAEVLLNYLTNWLSNHILKEDMAYKDFFIDQGLR